MYVEQLHSYGNVVACNGCISYYYKIKPINSLFASDTQLEVLIKNLSSKILNVNMPGAIVIPAKRINEESIVNYYNELFKLHGRKELIPLKEKIVNDLKKQLGEKIRYRYDIYIVFTDGREDLHKKFSYNLFGNDNAPLDKYTQDACKVVDEQIFKKLSADLSVERPSEDLVESLHNYLAIPVEGTIAEYYIDPKATELQYEYKFTNQIEFSSVYSRTFIASKLKENKLQNACKANTVINDLQLYPFPVDTVVKFDLQHTNQFKKNMTSKKEEIRKHAHTYNNLSNRRDLEADKANELAKIGEEVDPSIEDSKIIWQLMVRIRASDEKMLNKRSDNLRKKFEGKGIELTYAIGDQEQLANSLFPFKTAFRKYTQLTDILYFAHFNFLGGLYIGEENEGIIISNTNPADLPVRIDLEAPIKGKTKNASSTTAICGETGGGKSQLANYIILMAMIFYGHLTLLIDPKGDRYKLIELLSQFGDICSHLIIGSKDCPSGMFDPFLLHVDDQVEALAKAKNDIMQLVRAVNRDQVINLNKIDDAYDLMINQFKDGKIKQLTLDHLSKCLLELDPSVADNLRSLRRDPMARLFFGNDDTDISTVFKLDKPFNLITFAKVPVYSDSKKAVVSFNENDLEHNIFSLTLAKVQEITNMFLRNNKGKTKTLLFDEAKIFKTIPGGEEIIVNNNLIARSELCDLIIILQNWSDLPDSVINNTGQFFVGSMKSKNEIDLILNHFNLDSNSSIKSKLLDRTKIEGVNKASQYNFLYSDYNDRKAFTKLRFLNLFETAFRTFKDDDSIHVNTTSNIGDDPYAQT